MAKKKDARDRLFEKYGKVLSMQMDSEGGRRMYETFTQLREAEKTLRAELRRILPAEEAEAVIDEHLYGEGGLVKLKYLFYTFYRLSAFREENRAVEAEDLRRWAEYRHETARGGESDGF